MTQQFQPGDRVLINDPDDMPVYTIGFYDRELNWYTLWLWHGEYQKFFVARPVDLLPFLPLAIARCCPYCYKLKSNVRVRELCTTYGGDYDLFDGCLECFNDYNSYYAEQIAKGLMS